MKIWVTGANGLLGAALCKTAPMCLASGREVDIADESAVRLFVQKNPGITHIVNCAAFSLVDLAETQKDKAFRSNVLGPENLACRAQEMGARLIHISTDYIFPGNLQRPLKETDPADPLNHYGKTKWEGEKRVQNILPSSCVIRTSWIFGHGGKNFVAKLLQMFRDQEEICLTDDQWGRFTYAPDLSSAILQMLDQSGLYHFANRGIATKFTFGCMMRDLAKAFHLPLATKSLVAVPGEVFPSVCKRPAYSAFDTSKIEAVLKAPIRSWQEALREFLCTFS